MINNNFLKYIFINLLLFLFFVPFLNKTSAETCNYTPTSTDSITGSINITEEGNYFIWSRILAPDNINNSFYIQIDGGCAINVGDSPSIQPNEFSWVNYQDGATSSAILVTLSPGVHTLLITEREEGIGIDDLLFIKDPQCYPAGMGDNCVTPTETPTPLPTATPAVTDTPTPTSIPTPTLTPTPTFTPTPTPTAIPTPTNTPTPLPTSTPTPIYIPSPTATFTPSPTPSSAPNGLQAIYYNNSNFTGTTFSRIDSTVNFNWGKGTPNSSIASETFSAIWTGYVVPKYSQKYTFYAKTDDGVRLWVNGVQLINNWKNQSATEKYGTITLTAGTKYAIRMEYYENTGSAVAQLSWSSSSQAKQIIPQSQLISK